MLEIFTEKLKPVTHEPLRRSILILLHASEELKNEDELRTAEINNIQQIIFCGIDELLDGNISTADEYFEQVKQRLNFLAANPDSAGEHEHHRDTLPAPPDSGERICRIITIAPESK